MLFTKSSFCKADTPQCVEVGIEPAGVQAPATVVVRDSKNQDGPVLRFTDVEWTAFLAGVAAGEFTLDALDLAVAAGQQYVAVHPVDDAPLAKRDWDTALAGSGI